MTQISYKQELLRKSFHMIGLIIPIGYFMLDITTTLWLLLPITVVVTIIDLAKHRSPMLARIYFGIFSSILRPHEREKKGLSGATPMFISAAICIMIFSKPIAIAAISTLIISDTCAALIGRKWGKHPFLGKSVEGTLAFTVSAWLVVLIVGMACNSPRSFYFAGAIIAPVVALIEVMSGKWKIDDNFSIPLSMGGLMTGFYIAADFL